MDDIESSHPTWIGKPKAFQKRDGSWAIACLDDTGVIRIGKWNRIPALTDFDRFENALDLARRDLETAVRAAIANRSHEAVADAFGVFDYVLFHALERLRP
jgi:hypothetical protein